MRALGRGLVVVSNRSDVVFCHVHWTVWEKRWRAGVVGPRLVVEVGTVEADTHVVTILRLAGVGLVWHADRVFLWNLVHLTLVGEQDTGLRVPEVKVCVNFTSKYV